MYCDQKYKFLAKNNKPLSQGTYFCTILFNILKNTVIQ